MNPNDNSSLVLVQSPLDNKNCQTWAKSMKVVLDAKSLIWCDSALLVGKVLRSVFLRRDIFHIANIQKDLAQFKQGILDISYFTQLTTVLEEIENSRLYLCNCCIRGVTSDLRKYKEQDKVIKFLKGLNQQFAHVRFQIMVAYSIALLNCFLFSSPTRVPDVSRSNHCSTIVMEVGHAPLKNSLAYARHCFLFDNFFF